MTFDEVVAEIEAIRKEAPHLPEHEVVGKRGRLARLHRQLGGLEPDDDVVRRVAGSTRPETSSSGGSPRRAPSAMRSSGRRAWRRIASISPRCLPTRSAVATCIS